LKHLIGNDIKEAKSNENGAIIFSLVGL